jgi:polygalacturonase
LNCAVGLLTTGCKPAAQVGNTSKSLPVINVKSFGAKADGVANDYNAIQQAIAELHRVKSGILFFPKGVYRVDEVFRQTEMGKVLNGRSHFIFRGLKNITIRGEKGTVISIKGDFHKKVEWEIKERNAGYSYTQQISFIFNQCKNVTVENLEINGNVDKMTRDKKVTEGPSMGLLFGDSINDEN